MNNLIQTIFSEELLHELNDISGSFDITDNNSRADAMMAILEDEGFIELGCGTNRLCVKHRNYPYAIKLALDDRGVKDNNAERALSKQEELVKYITTTYENNGLVLLSEKVEVMKSEDYDFFKKQIMEVMKTLAPIYILNDIGPTTFRNWGIKQISEDIEIPVIIDYAYMTRIDMAEIKRCIRKDDYDELCDGKLMYSEDFKDMICKRCGKHYSLEKIAGGTFVDPLVEEGYYVPGVTD